MDTDFRETSSIEEDKAQRSNRDKTIEGRLHALYRSTSEQLIREEDTILSNDHQGCLYVKGILLRLPYSQVLVPPASKLKHQEPSMQFGYPPSSKSRREQILSMSQEAFPVVEDQNERYDFLFVSAIPIVDMRLIWLHLMVLRWHNGIAQRVGVAKVLFSEDKLVKLWTYCDARYQVFWLG